MCCIIWQQCSFCQFNSKHLHLLLILNQQHFIWSCHDLHLHLKSNFEVFSSVNSVHQNLNNNLCCCSFFCWHYSFCLSSRQHLQFFDHLDVLWMIKKKTDMIRECLSILKITMKKHKISNCISEVSTSLMWHVWWVELQCHYVLKISSVKVMTMKTVKTVMTWVEMMMWTEMRTWVEMRTWWWWDQQ